MPASTETSSGGASTSDGGAAGSSSAGGSTSTGSASGHFETSGTSSGGTETTGLSDTTARDSSSSATTSDVPATGDTSATASDPSTGIPSTGTGESSSITATSTTGDGEGSTAVPTTDDGGTTAGIVLDLGTVGSTAVPTTDDGGTTAGIVLDLGTVDPPDPACPLDCIPPCDLVLSQNQTNLRALDHDGTHILAVSSTQRLALFDAASFEVVLTEERVAWAELVAGVLAVAGADGIVRLRSAADLQPLGEILAAGHRGLSTDASYLWAADATELQVFGVDGSSLVSATGDFTDAEVLALPDGLHIYAAGYDHDAVVRLDLASGALDSRAFEGDFGGWFGDTPRLWSEQGLATRLYDVDGTQLAVEVASIEFGWGDYVVTDVGVAHVSDLMTAIIADPDLVNNGRGSGPAWASGGLGGADVIAVLDPAGPYLQPFAPGTSLAGGWQFAWNSGAWVLNPRRSQVADQLGRGAWIAPYLGSTTRVDPAIAGRFAVTFTTGNSTIFDVVDECTVEVVGELTLPYGDHAISPDGSTIVSNLSVPVPPAFSWSRWASLFQALPDGGQIAVIDPGGCSTCAMRNWSMSNDASVAAHQFTWTGPWWNIAFALPSGETVASSDSNVIAAIAPDGAHVVVTDGDWGPGSTYEGTVNYVYEDGEFINAIDGVAWGFIDNERFLVSRYESDGSCFAQGACDDLIGTDIVELDGAIVQSTTLPDIRRFQRISDTEIFALDPPRIFDVYTGELLWTVPQSPWSEYIETAGAIGPDLVVWSVDAELVVQRWR